MWRKKTCSLCTESEIVYHDKLSYQNHLAECHTSETAVCAKCDFDRFPDIIAHCHAVHSPRDRDCHFCKTTITGHMLLGNHISINHRYAIGMIEPEEDLCTDADLVPSGAKLLDMMKNYFKEPLLENDRFQFISFKNYALYFDTELQAPLICFEALNFTKRGKQKLIRPDFYPHKPLGYKQVTPQGIHLRNYVCGHVAAAANHSYDKNAFKDTFALCNIVAMKKSFNNGSYKSLEGHVRRLRKLWQHVLVVTELIYDPNLAKETAGGYFLHIPTKVAKSIHLSRPGRKDECQVFVLEHTDESEDTPYIFNEKNLATIDDVVKITGRKRAQTEDILYSWNNPETNYLCKKYNCFKAFSSKDLLDKHYTTGHKANTCNFCTNSFDRRDELHNHMIEKHSSYPCEFCDKSFPNLHNLTKHSVVHKDVQLFDCPLCKTKLKKKESLTAHLQMHKYEKGYDDALTTVQSFHGVDEIVKNADVLDLKATITLFIGNLPTSITDSILMAAFGKFGSVTKVQIFSVDDTPQPCAFVEFETSEMACNAKRHRMKLSEEIKGCVVSYYSNPKITWEFTSLMFRLGKTFKCRICPFSCWQISRMEGHVRTHTGEKPFECVTCGERFPLEISLNSHQKLKHKNAQTQAGAEIDSVEEQNLPSSSNQSLKNIALKRKQNRYKPKVYFCKPCNQSFDKKVDFDNHMKEKNCNNLCEFCDESFTCSTNRIRHLIVHTDVKPFQCQLCQMKFTNKNPLVDHLRGKLHKDDERVENALQTVQGLNERDVILEHIHELDPGRTNTLFIGNLPTSITDTILMEAFGKFGSVVKVQIVSVPDDTPKPCAFIRFETADMACNAKRYHKKLPQDLKDCQVSYYSYSEMRWDFTTLMFHSDGKWKCRICSSSILTKFDVKAHIRKHTGQKPFKCETCKRTFTVVRRLNNHRIKMHNATTKINGNGQILNDSKNTAQNVNLQSNSKKRKATPLRTPARAVKLNKIYIDSSSEDETKPEKKN